MLKCPECNSEDVSTWCEKIEIGKEKPVTFYRCYNCGKIFEDRYVKGCGHQPFIYGDNFPVFKKEDILKCILPAETEEHKNFKLMGKITKEEIVDTLIDLFGKEIKE